MVGVELRQAKAQLTVSRIAIRRQGGLTPEIGVAIHANRLVDGFGSQLRLEDIPSQFQGISRSDGETRSVGKRFHLELISDGCHMLRIHHKPVRLELRGLVIKRSRSIKTTCREVYNLVQTSRAIIHRIGIRAAIPDLMPEAQGIIVHHHQGFIDFRKNTTRDQLTFKPYLLHRQVVKTVYDKRIQAVIELATEILGNRQRVEIAGVKSPFVDFPIELITFGIAMEDRIFRRDFAARLIVALINEKTTFQPLQGAVNRNDMFVVAGIKTQRVHFVHLNHEFFVQKQTVFGEELKHTRKDAARKPEVFVFLQRDSAIVGHNYHTLAVAQRNGRAFKAVNLAGDTINEQVVGGQVEAQVGLTVGGHRVEFNHVIIDFFIVGINHVEEPRQSRHPLGLGVIFQITFRLQTQHHGDDLLSRIAKIGSQVAEIEMHLTFHVVEALQELLKTYHRMHAIEALQTLKIIVPIIIDRHHMALTPMVDAFHAPEIH